MIPTHLPRSLRPTSTAVSALALLALLAGARVSSAQAPCAVGWTPAQSPVPLGTPNGVAIGDIDGINGPDAAVANQLLSEVVVLLNDGTGALTPSPNPPLSIAGDPFWVVLADFDGVNGDDLLVVRLFPRQALLFYNDGTGGFQAGPVLRLGNQTGPALAVDLDGQNGLDVVVADINGVAWFLADGNGGFGARQYMSLPAFPYIATGDFDGRDGPDLAVTSQTSAVTGFVHVLLNDGAGGFTTAPGSPHATYGAPSRIAVAELDGAPGDDIVYLDGNPFYNPPFTVEALFNDGAGSFLRSRITTLPAEIWPEDLQLADVDGSAMADVVMAVTDGLQVLLNDGAGTFQPSGEGTVELNPHTVNNLVLGDLDGQLGPDLVATSPYGDVIVLHNAIATTGVPGQNLLSVHAAGASLLPQGMACPTLDLSAGGTFALDVEGRQSGLPVVVILQLGACATLSGGVLPFASIPSDAGYSIPANCASGSNRVFQLPFGGSPVSVGGVPLAFDPARGVHTAQLPFSLPAGAGNAVVATQAVILDTGVPGGLVLTNAINLQI